MYMTRVNIRGIKDCSSAIVIRQAFNILRMAIESSV